MSRSHVFRALVADLAAPLHHRPKDEMIGEDVRQHRRNRLLATGAAVALAVLALAATVFAVDSRNQAQEANRQRRLADARTCLVAARQLVTQSQATVEHDPAAALRMGVTANALLPGPETEANVFALLSASRFAGSLPSPGFNGTIRVAVLTRDGHTLATGDADGQVLLWNVDRSTMNGLAVGSLPGRPTTLGMQSLAFSADGRILAGGINQIAVLWNVSDPANPRPIGPPIDQGDNVTSVALSPDGHRLAVDTYQGVALWDVTDPTRPQRIGPSLIGGGQPVFSPDGRRLATVEGARSVVLWDLAKPDRPRKVGPPLAVIPGPPTDPRTVAFGQRLPAVSSVAFAPNGHMLATADDHNVIVWDVTNPTSPTRIGTPLTDHTGPVTSVAFTPDGHTLASGSDDHTVILWDVTDPSHPHRVGSRLGHPDPVMSVMFGAGGAILAGYHGNAVTLWDVADSVQPRRTGPVAGHLGPASSAAFAPDGHMLATAGTDGAVIVWDITNPTGPARIGAPLTGHTGPVNSVAFAPGGHTLASGGNDHTVILWDITDPNHAHRTGEPLTGHTSPVNSVAFTPDGHTLASGSDDHTVILWDVTDPNHAHNVARTPHVPDLWDWPTSLPPAPYTSWDRDIQRALGPDLFGGVLPRRAHHGHGGRRPLCDLVGRIRPDQAG